MRAIFNVVSPKGHLSNLRFLISTRANTTAATTQEQPPDWDTAKPFESIPGPKPLPLIGNMWRFIPGIGEYAKFDVGTLNEKFFNDFGKISRFGGIPGRKDFIFLYDPADAETVFRNEGPWPIREGLKSFTYYREVIRKDFFKDAVGLLTAQGEEWGKFRTIVNQPMMQPRVARNYVAPIDEVAEDLVKRISMLRDTNSETPADFINELYKWALESIAMIALDTRLGCLQPSLAPDSEAQQMINQVHILIDTIFELEMKPPIWMVISTPTWRRFVKSADYVRETGLKYVNQALERMKAMPADSDRERSILERILARDPNPKVACVMAMDMMQGGIDTTSHAMGMLLYHLATNQEKQKKLQEEIDRVLPISKSGQERITPDNLNDLKYLKACIKESMRISPIINGNGRTTTKDLILQGYKVPKGTFVIMGHRAMSLMEENYPQADQFIPERWLRNDLAGEHKTHPFVTMPFGFGPRMCIGRRFAELEIEVLVTKILQKYKIEWHNGPMVIDGKFINACKSPLKFKMVDRA